MANHAFLRCIHPTCAGTRELSATVFTCPKCNGLMDVAYDWDHFPVPKTLQEFQATEWTGSGVWHFRRLLPFAAANQIVSIGEGRTLLQRADRVAIYAGMSPGSLFLQYEGFNPSGSFKDNGMSAAFTHAQMTGARRAACASTGNTSASLAMYCVVTGLMRGIVFVGSGKISYGKLSQALDFGALTLQIAGDFDDAMKQVQQVSRDLGIYLVNSINPFRLEGQKTIMYRVLEGLNWQVPDWIIVPGGNLGNVSAFGKAFIELEHLGLIAKRPRFAVINAAGADTFFQLYERNGLRWNHGHVDQAIIDQHYANVSKASTLASAIEINRPVNLTKALRAMDFADGVVRAVTDTEIMDAKAQVGSGGYGCEPASAASVAGLKKLRNEGVISPSDCVVCILTGHQLKDPNASIDYHLSKVKAATYSNQPIAVANDLEEITAAITAHS